MARLLGPDAGSRLAYWLAGDNMRGAPGRTATIYTDTAGTVLADILTYDGTGTPGAAIAGSTVTIDTYSQIPRFWFPDSVDTVYARVNGGPPWPVNADYDYRLDTVSTGIYVVTDPKYGAVGTELAAAAQAAINAIPAIGGTLYIPAGAWTFATPLTLKPNLRIAGAGRAATRITATAGAFTWTGTINDIVIEHMYVQANGGHVIAPANTTSGIYSAHIRDCILSAAHANYSVFSMVNNDWDYDNVRVENCDLYRSGSATVPGWHITNGGGAANCNTWRQLRVFSANCTSTPFFHIESTSTGNYTYDNRFEDILGEQNPGGLIRCLAGYNWIISNVTDFDASVNYVADVIHVGKSAVPSGLRSNFVTISNSGRRGGTLGGGVYDINLPSGGTARCTIISGNHSSSGFRINFGAGDVCNVINAYPGSWTGQPASGGSVFGAQVQFPLGIVVGATAVETAGTGTPETVVTGSPGDRFVRTDGGAGTSLYVKETGAATTTGWTAYPPPAAATLTAEPITGAGEITPIRMLINNNAIGAQTSGSLQLVYFTATKTETVATVDMWSGSIAAAATPTLVRIGVYSVATNGDLTLVASTTNDTSLFAATNTLYNKAFTSTWGKVAGTRYAVGALVVSAGTVPNYLGYLMGTTGNQSTIAAQGPRLAGRLSGLADLPGTAAAGTLTAERSFIAAQLKP